MTSLKKNIILLALVQLSNYLFPLLSFPYLSRVLGPEGFGQVALAQSIIMYFTLFIDFGFNLSATRRISLASIDNSKNVISEIYSSVTFSKLLLFFLSCILCYLLTTFWEQFGRVQGLVFIGFISLLGSVAFPLWLFQGIQKMAGVITATSIAKLISLAFIFLIVKTKDDVAEAMFSLSLGMFLSGLISIFYVRVKRIAVFYIPRKEKIVFYLKDSFPLFLSFFFSSIYTTMNTLILGVFSTMYSIGVYSAAEKIKSVSQSAISPIQQSVYPRLSSQVNNKKEYIKKIKYYGFLFFFVGICISIFLAFLSKPIIHFLLGGKFDGSYSVLLWMSPLPAIITLAIIFGQWGLVNIGKSKTLSKIYMFGGITHLTHIFFMIKLFGIYGAVISSLITESILTLLMIYFFIKEVRKI
ncbi:TPA: flippase [Klebsiella pneumoniae subsp. pneumoniae]|uniref:flippase n=1 Tax=Klebsiella pneumoniae TaxID=573 RepID=UPI001CD7AB84|nr:flippase [Klebsiella pneumoniae]HDS8991401.1 flippase [Klebsiella pneumoniae subsp. pneumoniae]